MAAEERFVRPTRPPSNKSFSIHLSPAVDARVTKRNVLLRAAGARNITVLASASVDVFGGTFKKQKEAVCVYEEGACS